MATTFIYALNDPETGECRYVGKSDNPKERLSKHLCEGRDGGCHRTNWIKSLLARELKPTLEILDEVPTSHWELWERAWIKASREIGMDLTNGTDGGDGFESGEKNPMFGKTGAQSPTFGRKQTPEQREKIKAARAKQIFTPEHRAKMGKALLGRSRPTEVREKISAAQIGSKKEKESSSKFRGVCWTNRQRKYYSRIRVGDSRKSLGYFQNEIDAARAYDVAAKKYHGDSAKLNFPNE